MRKLSCMLAVTCMVGAFAVPAVAATDVKVSGLIWGGYNVKTGDENTTAFGRGKGYNAFNLDHAYITTNAKFDDHFSALMTIDAGTGQSYFPKYVYFQVNDVLMSDNLRVGTVPTLWAGYELGYWNYGFQSLDVATSFLGIAQSAQGVTLSGKAMDMLSYDLGVFEGQAVWNGAAISAAHPLQGAMNQAAANADTRKDYQARLGLEVLPGLELSSFYSLYRPMGYDKMDSMIDMIAYKADDVTLAAEYAQSGVTATGGKALVGRELSAFGIVGGKKLGEKFKDYDAVLRINNADNNTDKAKGDTGATVNDLSYTDYTVGIGYHPVAGIDMMLSDTMRVHEESDNTKPLFQPNENIVSLSYGVSF